MEEGNLQPHFSQLVFLRESVYLDHEFFFFVHELYVINKFMVEIGTHF